MLEVSRSSTSLSIRMHSRALGNDLFQSDGHHQNQLIDDTANILATMVQARRSIFNASLLTRQVGKCPVKSSTVIEFQLDTGNVRLTECKSISPSSRVTKDGQRKGTVVSLLFLTSSEQSNRPLAVLPPTDSSSFSRRASNLPKPKRTTENVLARAANIVSLLLDTFSAMSVDRRCKRRSQSGNPSCVITKSRSLLETATEPRPMHRFR